MIHQQRHTRHSKRGKIFPAGRGIKKDKDLSYAQLKRRHKIARWGDDDKDGVPNYRDCRPWDKKKQDEPEKDEFRLSHITKDDEGFDAHEVANAEEARDKIKEYHKKVLDSELPYDFEQWSDAKVLWFYQKLVDTQRRNRGGKISRRDWQEYWH